jgi:hypothetical protein
VATIFDEQLGEEVPALHVIGNHCLSVPRATLLERLRIPSCYYSRRCMLLCAARPHGPHGAELAVLLRL